MNVVKICTDKIEQNIVSIALFTFIMWWLLGLHLMRIY